MAFKKIKIGNVSIREAMSSNIAYVDKTRFIELLENDSGTDVPVFLRPRRFGKTFLTFTIFNYYDKSQEGRSEENFKGTWIYSHKTPMANSYYCLRLDFSSISPKPDSVE